MNINNFLSDSDLFPSPVYKIVLAIWLKIALSVEWI